ncbi:MAG: glycosyltransferase, partial [Chloroflexota bacterium]
PNVDAMMWFAAEVLPLITPTSNVQLYIVGQKPHPRLASLRMNPNIEITGWVAEVQPYLHAADVYIAPLRMGSGTRLKMLEAMAAGCAIVATPTAAAGLSEEAKAHMVVTPDANAMAAAVRHLLTDANSRRQLGQEARAFVQNTYDWSVLVPRLLGVYQIMGLTNESA